MAKTIALTKSNGVISVSVNGGPPRTLAHLNNIMVKPLSDGSGAVVKLTDESWRLTVYLADTVSKDGVTSSPYASQTALVNDMSSYFN